MDLADNPGLALFSFFFSSTAAAVHSEHATARARLFSWGSFLIAGIEPECAHCIPASDLRLLPFQPIERRCDPPWFAHRLRDQLVRIATTPPTRAGRQLSPRTGRSTIDRKRGFASDIAGRLLKTAAVFRKQTDTSCGPEPWSRSPSFLFDTWPTPG